MLKPINFTGSISIISAFPAIGKTHFATSMSEAINSVTRVIDFDIGDFRQTHPELQGDDLYDAYVEEIDNIHNTLILSRMAVSNKTVLEIMDEFNIQPGTDRFKEIAMKNPVTAFILVSSHEEVRKRLTKKLLKYYYVYPTVHQLIYFIDIARARYEHSLTTSDANALSFMVNHAEEVIRNDYHSDFQIDIKIDYPYFLSIVLDECTDYFTFNEFILRKITEREASKMAISRKSFPKMTIDHQGRIVLMSEPLGVDKLKVLMEQCGMPKKLWAHSAYNHQDFIILSRGDGEALYQLLSEMAKDRYGTTDSYTAFGTRGISYERLYDRLVGTCYSLWPSEVLGIEDDEDSD